MNKHKEAWLNQFIATGEIERILVTAAEDTSTKNIERIAASLYGKESVKLIHLGDTFTEFDSDRVAVQVNETVLFFKGGEYHGSKANLPNH